MVCQIGCDFGMDEVMAERNRALLYTILAAVLFTIIVLIVAVVFIRKIVIKPINSLSSEMKKFHPSKHSSYADAGVTELDIRSYDEIQELYEGVRTMEINIIDYLNDMDTLQKDKERAEEGIRTLDEEIGHIREEVNKDTLTDQSVEPWERYSAAVGMAEHASDDRSLDLIFIRADKAMYEDKQEYKKKFGSYR